MESKIGQSVEKVRPYPWFTEKLLFIPFNLLYYMSYFILIESHYRDRAILDTRLF